MPRMKPRALSLSLTLAKPLLLYSSLTWRKRLRQILPSLFSMYFLVGINPRVHIHPNPILTLLIRSRLNPWRSPGIVCSPLVVMFASKAFVRSYESSFTVNLTISKYWLLWFPTLFLPGHSGGVHLVEAGGKAGALEFSLLIEDVGVAVGSVRDVHRHTSCVHVGGEGPVLETAVSYRPHMTQVRPVLRPVYQTSLLPLLFSLCKRIAMGSILETSLCQATKESENRRAIKERYKTWDLFVCKSPLGENGNGGLDRSLHHDPRLSLHPQKILDLDN